MITNDYKTTAVKHLNRHWWYVIKRWLQKSTLKRWMIWYLTRRWLHKSSIFCIKGKDVTVYLLRVPLNSNRIEISFFVLSFVSEISMQIWILCVLWISNLEIDKTNSIAITVSEKKIPFGNLVLCMSFDKAQKIKEWENCTK